MKRVLSILGFALGEAVLVAVFLIYVLPVLGEEITYLDIAVSSIIYMSLFIDVFFSWVNMQDESHRQVGSIGIRWMTVLTYGVLAIAAMIVGAFCEFSFNLQLLIHLGLFVFYILGWAAVLTAESKVANVHAKEQQQRQGVNEVKSFIWTLNMSAKSQGSDPSVGNRLAKLEEEMRYVSPSSSAKALLLDRQIMDVLKDIEHAILSKDCSGKVQELANRCETLISERKKTY